MSIEAMKQALEALEKMVTPRNFQTHQFCQKAYDDLRQAIAEAEKQEPVAWESVLGAVARGWCYEENANKTMDSELAVAIAKEVHALYTTPQQRTWVGLTLNERNDLYEKYHDQHGLPKQGDPDGFDYERAIEAKLKEKNT